MSPSLTDMPERDPQGNPIPAEFAHDIHGNDYGDPPRVEIPVDLEPDASPLFRP